MNILVIGGTRYFGKRAVGALLSRGHSVTVTNRGSSSCDFSGEVRRVILDRTSHDSVMRNLGGECFDVIFDSIAYCSHDVECLLDNVRCGRYVFTSSTAVYHKHPNTAEALGFSFGNVRDYMYDLIDDYIRTTSVKAMYSLQ